MGIFSGPQVRTSSWGAVPPVPTNMAPWAGYGGSSAESPSTAMQSSAVWACVDLVSKSIAMLPCRAFRGTPEVPIPLATQPKLLTNPSGMMTQSQWLREFMVSELLRGNTYGLITARDGYTYPTAIRLLNPDSVEVKADDRTGEPIYTYAQGTRKVIPAADMWHVPGLTFTGDLQGMSVLSYAASTVGRNLSAGKFAKDFLDGDGMPKGILESDMSVNQTQAQGIKDRFLAASRDRQPVSLGAGVKFVPLQVKPDESQFLKTMAASDAEIARFFGVPPAMIGAPEGSSMTYSNREQRALDFLTYAVAFWLKRIEDALTAVLPNSLFVKFDPSELLRTDVETDTKVKVQLVAGHIMAPSEIRTKLGMPPMTEAQKIETQLVPLQVTPAGTPKALPGVTEIPGDANPPTAPTLGAP